MTGSIYDGQMRVYWISSVGHPRKGNSRAGRMRNGEQYSY